MHEHHGPGGRIVRHVHPDGALEHGHDELTPSRRWRWQRERSYSTRQAAELTDKQRRHLEAVGAAHAAYLAAPLDLECIAARRREVAAAFDAGASLAAIGSTMGITRQAVHRLVRLARAADA